MVEAAPLDQRPWGFEDTVEIPVLGAEELERIRGFVHAQREHWTHCHESAPFYVLGAAAYVEAQTNHPRAYHLRATKMNRVLERGLDWLYARLLPVFSQALGGERTYYQRRFARPGFHIFLAHPAFTEAVCKIHIDLQYEHLQWFEGEHIDTARPLSFTLPIALPSSGAGLNVWDMHRDEFLKLQEGEIAAALAKRRFRYHTYQPGRMVVHSGHLVHQIAPFAAIAPGEERLTLQGHLLRTNGAWQLYW